MNNADITKRNIKLVKDLVAKIKDMTEQEFKEFLKSISCFHNYSLYNQFILHYSGCSQVAGFKKWQSLGRTIKKGSKAVWILAPNGTYTIKKEVKNKEGKTEQKEIVLRSFRSVPVFDIKDTEGKEIKAGLTEKAQISFNSLKCAVEKQGLKVCSKPLELNMGGYISRDNITLNSNLNEANNTGTLIHEYSHYLLGHAAANDITGIELREQEAEILTFLFCNNLGIERKSEMYLKSWNTNEEVINSIKKINKAYVKGISDLKEVA